MKVVLIINGSATAGKDTFVAFFSDHIGGHNVWNYSSVTKVKEIAEEMGWKGEKGDKHRRFLSDLKDLWTNYNDGPFNDIAGYIDRIPHNAWGRQYIFIHIREPKEIDKLKHYCERRLWECHSILIERPECHVPNNHADMCVKNYEYDFTIVNDSDLRQFQEEAKYLAKCLEKNECE